MTPHPPLIVTIKLDSDSHSYFTELRNKYFPAYCNYLEAHITFFHRLPSNESVINEVLKKFSNRQILNLEVTGIKNIGNGNVFTVASSELQQLHKTMEKSFEKYLTSKDKKKWKPHITVQNKVTAFKAKQTSEILLRDFKPFTAKALGFTTWHFLKGPWQHKDDYLFSQTTI